MADETPKKSRNFFAWIIMALLIVGLLGFGTSQFSSTASSIGTVADQEIPANDFYLALRNETAQLERQFGRTFSAAEIQQLGVDRQVLAQLLTQAAFDQEAADMGLSAGDDRVREQIMTTQAFFGISGNFDRETYRETLSRSNSSEQQYEATVRKSFARDIVQSAVINGVAAPDAYADTIIGFLAETRDFNWATVDASTLITGRAVPTDADLQSYYDANPAAFTAPATKDLAYIWITPAMLVDGVTVPEDQITAAYAEREAEFNQPERRLVERLSFPDTAAAEAALAQITAGEASFDTLVTDRGLTLNDVDLGDVQKRNLGTAGEVVFTLAEPGIVGPVESDFGPALFRVVAILEARNTSLEDARPQLVEELAIDLAKREIDGLLDPVADLLASGGTLEEVADETPLELGTLAWSGSNVEEIAGYSEFQELANRVTADDFAELVALSDGGIFAVEMRGETSETLRPFDDVAEQVRAGWEAEATQKEVIALAETLSEQARAGVTLDALGLTVQAEENLSRRAFVDGASPALVSTVFEMELGEIRHINNGNGAIIVELSKINAADTEAEDTKALADLIAERAIVALSQDILQAYANALQSDLDVSVDQAGLQYVISQVR